MKKNPERARGPLFDTFKYEYICVSGRWVGFMTHFTLAFLSLGIRERRIEGTVQMFCSGTV